MVPPVSHKLKNYLKIALHSILTKFGQWDDLIISQLQAIFQPFWSYPPLGVFLVKLAN